MKYEVISLSEKYHKLGEKAYVECYIPSLFTNADPVFNEQKWPAMVVCPGGGYGFVSDREAEPIALQFTAENYRVFVVRYSCAPACFPQQLREVAATMELIYENAESWNIDTKKISIIGFSAGGHLASQYSNRWNCPEVRALFPESKPVQAAVLSYPVITADERYSHAGSIENFKDANASCEKLVTAQTPPTFLWHTAEDGLVPVENSLIYAMALSAKKVPYELHIYPHGYHGLATADVVTNLAENLTASIRRTDRWMDDVKSWLKMVL